MARRGSTCAVAAVGGRRDVDERGDLAAARRFAVFGGAPPWIRIEHDIGAFWNGRFEPREVLVAQPVLRLKRRKDGTYNIQGLLADPLPTLQGSATPGVTIQNGVLQLEDDQSRVETVLHELSLRVEPAAGGPLRFEGSARGEDLFNRVELSGIVDPKSGRVTLTKGNLTRLTISRSLAARLPRELRPWYRALGLTAGEIDVSDVRCDFDMNTRSITRLQAKTRLRYGFWKCDRLPFPLNDVSADLTIRDGQAIIDRAEGVNGKTKVHVEGRVSPDQTAEGPLDLLIKVEDLALDDRLLRLDSQGIRRLLGRFPAFGPDQSRTLRRPGPNQRTGRRRCRRRLPRRRHDVSPFQVSA